MKRSNAVTRKARLRRIALECLEARALMAVLPSPILDPQIPVDTTGLDTARRISNDGPSAPGNDSSPQIAVDRYDPNKLVAIWNDHDANLGNQPNYAVRGAFSTNAGLTWTSLSGLPGIRFDPSSGTNPHLFDSASTPSVAFDGNDNFYVLEIQHSADYLAAGDVILQPFSFSGTAPAAKTATTVYSWNRSATIPIVKAIRDASLAVDDNLASFTDPSTGLVQTDIGANRVYIATETDVPIPSGYTGPWNFNTIELLASLDGGSTFGAPVTAGAGHFQNIEFDAAPRLAVSQGRAPGTNGVTDPGTTGGQVTLLFDDFHSARTANPPQDIIWATPFTPSAGGVTSLGQQFVTSTIALGAANSPYGAITSAATPTGIGPGAVIASDNTLGSFHANQGRLYVAYVDRYDPIRYGGAAAPNPADNTDIFLMTSDDGGLTWDGPTQVNDDASLFDGYSASIVSQNFITGRPQFMPALAVDPVTGTLAVSYEDTRFDPARARTVSSIQLSSDGGNSFNAATQGDLTLKAYDQTTQNYVSVGPVPMNQFSKPDVGQVGLGGIGDRQGLAIYGGRLYDAFITNMNGGTNTNGQSSYEVHVAPMLYASGPRVISSTMGQVGAITVTDLNTNQPITFNNQFTADGTPIVDGFVVTFDRPIDPTSFVRANITVTYRDPFTPGSQPGIPVAITQDPTPLRDGTTVPNAGGTTKYLVRFAAQSNVGTYSYTVGPNIRDLYRNTLATNIYYADQSAANLPAIPPVGTGGSGNPASDNATSKLVIPALPVSQGVQGILDLDVLVTLNHPADGDLVLKLIPPPGYVSANPALNFILLSQNRPAGFGGTTANFADTTFDDQARTTIAQGKAPFTGHFRPESLLRILNGKSPSGTWTLEIDDTRSGNTGKLVSWGLKITTSNRSFDGKFTQSGVAAQTGNLMDQNGDGLGGQNPNTGGISPVGSEFVGLTPGDVYAVPTPNPTLPEIFNGQNVNPPFDSTTLPLMISGPHVVRSFVPGAAKKTLDNLITDQVVPGFDIVFDRDMDPNTITLGNHISRFITPYGTFSQGQVLPDGSTIAFQIKADPNADPNNPNSDPDTAHPRTYQVVFMRIPAGGTTPIAFPQTQSGNYSVVLTSDIQDKNGDPLDSNQNAGLDFLRGTASAGTLPQTYPSQAPVTLAPGLANESDITVLDSFLVKNVVVGLNIDYPQDSQLTATLIAPDGFSVLLFSNVGNVGNGQNFTNTFLDDSATTAIANGGPPFFGRFNPQQPLSQFIDHFSAGTWRLRIDVPAGAPSGTIVNWSLKLSQPLSNSGLGETVADQATESFRIFTLDPTNPLAANTWTAIGPNGEGAKVQGGNAEVTGRVGAIAIDPSDASGNTVYVSGATGGIWKTTNFLTKSAAGPTYLPLTDNATILGMSISSIAIFPRNNDPNQSIIFATTGDSAALANPLLPSLSSRSIGFLRSMDGGATWNLLDSRDNTSPGVRDHFFASIPGQAGVTTYKIIVDPKPATNGQTIVYAALADIDGNGNLAGAGSKGGVWKSLDGGNTWKQMRGGQATDINLDLNSVNPDSGNLDFLYAAFRGDGVYFSPNAAQVFNLMTGTVGDPLIENADNNRPVPVLLANTPNSKPGLITLAKPALTGKSLPDLIYQGWLYAAVDGSGLYMTKDFGQNWVQVQIAVGADSLPSNDIRNPLSSIGGAGLSLAVDPTNPNVVFIGNTVRGLIRVDTTGIHDAHAFYLDSSNSNGALRTSGGGAVNLLSPTSGPYGTQPPSYDPITNSFINLIRDPADPFAGDATIRVHNSAGFTNDGSHITWTPFNEALTPDPFASSSDPWSRPTTNVHQILTIPDPLTGKARLLVATDLGIYTAVSDASGNIIASIGGQATLDTNQGNVRVVYGSRNGDLAIAQYNQGAAQPSQLAADLSTLKGFFYGNTQDLGISQSDPNIIKAGSSGYGNLSYNVDTIIGRSVDRGTGRGLATQQTIVTDTSTNQQSGGTLYAYRVSLSLDTLDARPVTDTFQVNSVGRTFGLYQTSNGGNTPDAQWPYTRGFNLVVNPLSDQQMLISSEAGRVFATTTQGRIWAEIGNPAVLDGTNAQALAYGAPDPAPPGGGLGSLNNYLFAGTKGGKIFVTFTGGGGSGNNWTALSGGLDGSPVQMIATNPNRGSHEAYAVTEQAVYHMTDARAGGNWVNITGNLFSILKGQFNDPTLGTQQILKTLTAVQADWRYLIPNDFTNPNAGTHPMLYVGGEGGVFRSLDGGQNWGLFPDGAVTATGTFNANGLLFSPAGEGGGLPNNRVTDLDLSLGNIDPTTGRPNVSTGPNLLMASTYGRGAYAIRLAPVVFPNSATNTTILTLSPTKPVPPGTSDSGFLNTDFATNVTNPVIEGLSEQSAFGNAVNVALFDVSDFSQAEIDSLLAGIPTRLPTPIPAVAGTTQTDSTGHFSVQVAPGYFKAFDPNNPLAVTTDGKKKILVQATNQSGTKGNFAPLGLLNFSDSTSYSFILDTTPPVAPATPDLTAASDSGLSNTDDITNITTGLAFSVALSTGEPATTHVYLVRDNDANIVDEKFGTAAPSQITLTDPGPVGEGDHFYYAYEVDLAGNKGPISGKLKIHVDTTRPSQPTQPVLDPLNPTGGSDSGIVGDNITNVKQPFLSGSGEAGGLMQVIDAAGNILSSEIPGNFVQPNGRYSVQVNLIGDGTYTLRTREEDVAGNLSQPSTSITITILSRTPASPTLFLVAADDSGTVGDNITNVNQPRLVGASTPGLSIQLILDSGTIPGVAIGGVIAPVSGQQPIVVAADGSYLIKFPNKLADGTYVVHTRVSDVAGNSAQSAPLTLTILGGGIPNPNPNPTPTPAAPTLILSPGDDSGIKGDNTTVVRRPRFTGTAKFTDGTIAANVPVDLIDTTGRVLAITTTTTTGNFTISLPNDLSNGSISVQARVRDVAGNPGPASNVVTIHIVTVAGDVNNDGKADLNSFNRSTSTFTFTNAAQQGTAGAGLISTAAPFLTQFGDIPYQGDFDGDGKIDYGFYRPGTSQWYLSQSRAGWNLLTFGQPNDLPVPADYDGDGVTDFATYRPSSGLWTIFQSGSGKTQTVSFGVPGLDQPVPADYDGVGHAEFAVYRPSTGQWLAALLPGRNLAFNPPSAGLPVYNVQYGLPNVDVPIPADYDGDAKIDVAVFRPSTGQWIFNFSKDGLRSSITVGQPNLDIPVPGDYDGDGKADFAVFRPTNAIWLIVGSASPGRVIASGQPNNVPLAAPLQPYRVQTALRAASFSGSSASDFSTSAAGTDFGRTAASFASSVNPVKSSSGTLPVTPPTIHRRRPGQGQGASTPKPHHVAATNGHHHDAALAKLGHFKMVRRPG